MKDFVFAPEVIFISFKFTYLKAFFIGTKNALFVCPPDRTYITTRGNNSTSIFNLFEGKRSDIFLMNLVNDPATNAEIITEKFAEAIKTNLADGHNNIAYINLAEIKRLRFNAKWYGNGIVASHSTNLITGDRISISKYGKAYTPAINTFYRQFYPMNKILKGEEHFK